LGKERVLMKRLMAFLLAVSLLLLPAASVLASTTWNLGQIQNGHWAEFFGPSGEGSPGGYLFGAGADDESQWSLSATLSSVASPNPPQYVSQYTNASLTLYDPSLGLQYNNGPITVTLASATNVSYFNPGSSVLSFTFTGSGTGDDTFDYTFQAVWSAVRPYYDPNVGHASYDFLASQNSPYGFPGNIGFTSITLTSSANVVPVPASLLLLGSGLLGLAGISRKFRKG
jgi:hypothetical protein